MSENIRTDIQNTIVESGGFLRVLPLNLSDASKNEIESLGIIYDFLTTFETDLYAYAILPDKKYFTKTLTTSVVLRVEKAEPIIDALTGQKVNNQFAQPDCFKIGLLANKTQKDSLVNWARNEKDLIACISLGINAEGTNVGFAHLIGRISDILIEERNDSLSELILTINGGKNYSIKTGSNGVPLLDMTTYNAVVSGTANAVSPAGKDTYNIKPLDINDWVLLLNGKIVRTDN